MRRLEWITDLLSLSVLCKAMCPTWGMSQRMGRRQSWTLLIHSFIWSVNQSQGDSYSMTGIEYRAVNIINIVPSLTVPILMQETASQAIINQ